MSCFSIARTCEQICERNNCQQIAYFFINVLLFDSYEIKCYDFLKSSDSACNFLLFHFVELFLGAMSKFAPKKLFHVLTLNNPFWSKFGTNLDEIWAWCLSSVCYHVL